MTKSRLSESYVPSPTRRRTRSQSPGHARHRIRYNGATPTRLPSLARHPRRNSSRELPYTFHHAVSHSQVKKIVRDALSANNSSQAGLTRRMSSQDSNLLTRNCCIGAYNSRERVRGGEVPASSCSSALTVHPSHKLTLLPSPAQVDSQANHLPKLGSDPTPKALGRETVSNIRGATEGAPEKKPEEKKD